VIRKRCVRRGHKWGNAVPGMLPWQFCMRALCDGCRVNPEYPMPEEMRAVMEAVVLEHMAARLREETR